MNLRPSQSMQEFVCCQICVELFDNPQSLPCGHVFCSNCCNRMKYRRKLTCPICRRECRFKDLRTDYRTITLVENYVQSPDGQARMTEISAHPPAPMPQLQLVSDCNDEDTLSDDEEEEEEEEDDGTLYSLADQYQTQAAGDIPIRQIFRSSTLAHRFNHAFRSNDNSLMPDNSSCNPAPQNSSHPPVVINTLRAKTRRLFRKITNRVTSLRRMSSEYCSPCRVVIYTLFCAFLLVNIRHYFVSSSLSSANSNITSVVQNVEDIVVEISKEIDREIEKLKSMKTKEWEKVEEKTRAAVDILKKREIELHNKIASHHWALRLNLRAERDSYKEKIESTYSHSEELLARAKSQTDTNILQLALVLKDLQNIHTSLEDSYEDVTDGFLATVKSETPIKMADITSLEFHHAQESAKQLRRVELEEFLTSALPEAEQKIDHEQQNSSWTKHWPVSLLCLVMFGLLLTRYWTNQVQLLSSGSNN